MSMDLPDAIATYFEIGNRRDVSQVPTCFAGDARVRDEGHEYRGHAAISEWLVAAQQKYQYRSDPVSATPIGTKLRVVATVTGNFPGSPAQLSYVFGLVDQKIASLEIG